MARMRKKKGNGSDQQPPSNESKKPSGFIFTCDQYTKPQCFQLQVFGLPISKLESVSMIEPGITLFLFDCQLKILYGVYTAASNGGPNLVPHAFAGKYPAQVNRLMYLFQERTVPRQPPPPIDSRNAHQAVPPPPTAHHPWPPSSVNTRHRPLAAPPPPPPPLPQQHRNLFYATPTKNPSSSTLPLPLLPQQHRNQFYATPTKNPSSSTLPFPTNVQYYAPPPSYPAPPPNYQHYPAPPNYQAQPATLMSQTLPHSHQFYPAPRTDPSYSI